jgi:copper chaperone
MAEPTNEEPEVRTTTLTIAGMSCGACVRHVATALEDMAGNVHVDVDLRKNEATIEHLPAFVDDIALIAAVRDAGYSGRVTRTINDADRDRGQSAQPSSCVCGCCGDSLKRTESWSNLGTSTIG